MKIKNLTIAIVIVIGTLVSITCSTKEQSKESIAIASPESKSKIQAKEYKFEVLADNGKIYEYKITNVKKGDVIFIDEGNFEVIGFDGDLLQLQKMQVEFN